MTWTFELEGGGWTDAETPEELYANHAATMADDPDFKLMQFKAAYDSDDQPVDAKTLYEINNELQQIYNAEACNRYDHGWRWDGDSMVAPSGKWA